MIETIQKYKLWLFAVIVLGGMLALYQRWQTWRDDSQDKYILAAAEKYQVNAALIKAVVWRESRFNPRAVGKKKERGLMQIQPATASDWAKAERVGWFTQDQLFDPEKNTQIGAWYLKKCLSRYQQTDNPVAYALADYNAGRTHVLEWMKDGEAGTNSTALLSQMKYPSTREYVSAVLSRYERYRRVFPPKRKT